LGRASRSQKPESASPDVKTPDTSHKKRAHTVALRAKTPICHIALSRLELRLALE
jgi:hypothetical protein